jgi:hypothetical protein
MEAGEEAQSSPTETEFPLRRPSIGSGSRTVLAGKGSLRRADARPCLLRAVRPVRISRRAAPTETRIGFLLTKAARSWKSAMFRSDFSRMTKLSIDQDSII